MVPLLEFTASVSMLQGRRAGNVMVDARAVKRVFSSRRASEVRLFATF